jgi:hypothetical protein
MRALHRKKMSSYLYVFILSLFFCSNAFAGVFFSGDLNGNWDIFYYDEYLGLNTLTTHSASDSYPRLSHDGSKVIFGSTRSGSRHDLWMMNGDGTNKQQVTSSGSARDFLPHWSPNDNKICFSSYRPWGAGGSVYVVDESGANEKRLYYRSGYDSYCSGYGPSGNDVYFFSTRRYGGGGATLYKINTDGNGLTAVLNIDSALGSKGGVAHADTNMATGEIVFTYSNVATKIQSIYKINSDGTGLTLLVANGTTPSWDQNGNIAYKSLLSAEGIELIDSSGNWLDSLYYSDGDNYYYPTLFVEPNNAPVADAGDDIQTYVGQNVILDGTASIDPDADDITYSWSENPLNPIQDILINANTATPEIYFSLPGIYSFTLTVSDGYLTDESTVVVDVLSLQGYLEEFGDGFQASLNSKLLEIDDAVCDLYDGNYSPDTESIISIVNKINATTNYIEAQTGKKIAPEDVVCLMPMLEIIENNLLNFIWVSETLKAATKVNIDLLELGEHLITAPIEIGELAAIMLGHNPIIPLSMPVQAIIDIKMHLGMCEGYMYSAMGDEFCATAEISY